ncbi:MAG: phenylacetate--CoA ligase family protein, partial [Lutibacter sp.]|nr:phenylacetate--CoA ligase family protein [Lutibacter sp.]
KCECGLQHLILEEVTGRIGQTVYGKNNTYPSLYFYYIFKNLATKQGLLLTYQVVQEEKGKLIFLIEQPLDSRQLISLKNEIAVYFKDDMEFTIDHTQSITAPDKKLKSFISNIA